MKKLIPLIFIGLFLVEMACQKRPNRNTTTYTRKSNKKMQSRLFRLPKTSQQAKNEKVKITFIELGSVNCVPCRMMQPVMRSLKTKYGDQINIIFYDVWQTDQKRYASEYKIRLIPTQIFLDEQGHELFRHEGFFPEDEIDKLLQVRGLTLKNGDNS